MRRLGADVTVLEGLPTFLGAVDEQIAKEAKKIGFIHERVDEEEFTQSLDNLVKHLVNASPNAVKVCKKLVQDVAYAEINEQLIKDTVAGIADIRASAEGKEGVQSFLQKRKPSWLNN